MHDAVDVVILCGGRGTRLQEHTAVDPQAAGRDRRPADRLARRPDLRRAGLRRFVLLHRLQGRADRGVRAPPSAGPTASTVRCLDTGLDTPTGGRIAPAARRARRPAASARPTPTAWPTSTSAALLALPPRPRRAGDDDRRAARAAVRRAPSSTATAACAASTRSRAPSTGSTAASSASSPACSTTSSRDSVLEREPLEGLAADGQLRAYRHRASGTAWTPTRTPCCSTTCGRRDAPWKVWA